MNLKLKKFLRQNFKLFIQSVIHRQKELRPIMTKVFCFTRESPRTNNDGKSQVDRIELAYECLTQMDVLPRLDGPIPRYNAHGDVRNCVLSSSVVHELFNAIKLIDKAECVVVLITSLLRIGTEFKKIMLFYYMLMECHPKVQLLFIDEYGLDLTGSARALSKYHASLRNMEVNHINPGASMTVSDEDRDLQKEVTDQASRLKKEWKNANSLPDEILASLQENITMNDILIKNLINLVRAAIRDGTSVEEVVQDFRKTLWPKTFSGAQQTAIYIRTSPKTSLSGMIDGIAIDQMSMCYSYYQKSPDDHEIVTFQDIRKRRSSFHMGLQCLLASVLDGKVGDVIMKNTNRISSKFSIFSAVLEICKQCGTRIHFAQMIGVDVLSAVRKDTERLAERKRYRKEYHEAIDVLKQEMNASDLLIRERLQEIQSYVISKSLTKSDDFSLEDDENWLEWTTLPKNVGENDDDD